MLSKMTNYADPVSQVSLSWDLKDYQLFSNFLIMYLVGEMRMAQATHDPFLPTILSKCE